MYKYILILVSVSMAFGCKPDLDNPEVKKMYEEVMVIHDEVMPEISTIHKLKKRIKKVDTSEESRQLVKELEDADESMMSWMSDFGIFRKMDEASIDEKLSFLETEKVKITKVSEMMKTSISKAKKYLGDE